MGFGVAGLFWKASRKLSWISLPAEGRRITPGKLPWVRTPKCHLRPEDGLRSRLANGEGAFLERMPGAIVLERF
jgi:hypothetical protein